jgi:hypothetical protein
MPTRGSATTTTSTDSHRVARARIELPPSTPRSRTTEAVRLTPTPHSMRPLVTPRPQVVKRRSGLGFGLVAGSVIGAAVGIAGVLLLLSPRELLSFGRGAEPGSATIAEQAEVSKPAEVAKPPQVTEPPRVAEPAQVADDARFAAPSRGGPNPPRSEGIHEAELDAARATEKAPTDAADAEPAKALTVAPRLAEEPIGPATSPATQVRNEADVAAAHAAAPRGSLVAKAAGRESSARNKGRKDATKARAAVQTILPDQAPPNRPASKLTDDDEK